MSAIPKTQFSPNLDLMRAVAVLCVFTAHNLAAFGIANPGSLGRFGVVMFFVHTSLVLMESLQRLSVVAASTGRLAAGFWVRRLFRIYPLSIFVVLLVAVARIPADPDVLYVWIGVKGILANLFLVQNLTASPDILGVLWSLPLEVQMYVILPVVYLLLRGKPQHRSLLLWALAIPLAIWLPRLNWRLGIAALAPCFLSGAVAYDLLRSRTPSTLRLPTWLWPAGIAAAILLFGPFDNVSLPHKLYRAWALSLFLGVLYVYIKDDAAHGPRRMLHWIAEHSYGIYLVHIPVTWLVLHPMQGAHMWLRALVFVGANLGVPVVLYRYLERPLMLLGGHLSRRVLREPAHRVIAPAALAR